MRTIYTHENEYFDVATRFNPEDAKEGSYVLLPRAWITSGVAAFFLAAIGLFADTFIFRDVERLDQVEIALRANHQDFRREIVRLDAEIAEVKQNDETCKQTNERQRKKLETIDAYVKKHDEFGWQFINDTNSRLARLEVRSDECIEHLKRDDPRYKP